MNNAVPTPCLSQFVAGQDGDPRNVGRLGRDLGTAVRHSVRSLDQHAYRSAALQAHTDLLETGDRLSRPAGQAQQTGTAIDKPRFDSICEIRANVYPRLCRFREYISSTGRIYHIAVSTQPKTPTRQPLLQIRDHLSGRGQHETDHRLAGATLAGGYAPSERPILLDVRVGLFGFNRGQTLASSRSSLLRAGRLWRGVLGEPMGAGGHDDVVGLLPAERGVGQDLKQFVGCEITEVVEGLDPRFAQFHEH